jgi:5-dehydro-2-deoxygluconokinase
MAINPADYPDSYLQTARALLLSGSHLTTGYAASNLMSAAERARGVGTKIVFDIDYRPLFWQLVGRDAGESRYEASAEATVRTQALLPSCDLVVGTEEEVHLAGGVTDTIEALRRIRTCTAAPIVLKRGERGCIVFPGSIPSDLDGGIVGPGFPVEVFNVVGAGDGFLSGFLYGWLRDRPWDECCKYGNACGAIVVSRHGCSPASPTGAELDWFLRQDTLRSDLRHDADLEEIHWATTRRGRPEPSFIVVCDHFAPFADLPCTGGRSVAAFKRTVAEAILQLQGDIPGLGVIFDDAEGLDALQTLGGNVAWVARKIEATGSVPLAFGEGMESPSVLREWPRCQVAKCLVPDCTQEQLPIQKERLRELFVTARQNGIELMLELVDRDSEDGLQNILSRIEEIQTLGIRPDWWNLPAFSEPAAWPQIEKTIKSRNPWCRGVLVLGADRPLDELARLFLTISTWPLVKGFAVGGCLVRRLAEEWLAGRIDNGGLRRKLHEEIQVLVANWSCREADAA